LATSLKVISGLEPLDQILGGQVDVDDLVGLGDDRVGDPFLDLDAGGRLDDVVKRFQMLDVERGDDADAGIEQFEDVLVAFLVFAAGRIGMGEFIDEDDGGLAGEDRVEIHFPNLDPVIKGDARGNDFQLADLGRGIGAFVGLHIADDDIDAALPEPVALDEHRVGFADAGR